MNKLAFIYWPVVFSVYWVSRFFGTGQTAEWDTGPASHLLVGVICTCILAGVNILIDRYLDMHFFLGRPF